MIEHLESGIRELVEGFIDAGKPVPVSYTHLTLPTTVDG